MGEDGRPGTHTRGADNLTARDNDQATSESLVDTPPGFSDESNKHEHELIDRHTMNQGPKRFGDPIKYSVRLICSVDDITDLNKAALEARRLKLAMFKTDTSKPTESKLGLLERHLFE